MQRFLRIDPLADKYVHNSTYAFSENKVTAHVELEGLESISIQSANPVANFIVNTVLGWRDNFSNGRDNLVSGANEKAASVTGQYSEQPAVAQSFHNVNSEVKMAAGLAEMNKPGLDVVSTIAGMTVGVEIPAAAPLVTGSSFGFRGSVSLSGNAVKLGETGVSLTANATKTVTQAESKVFLVTKEGVVLPKGAKIPGEFIENAHRSSNYGEMQNGKFVEKLRIDPATPSGFKGPNQSHFHLNNGGHIFDASKWPWW